MTMAHAFADMMNAHDPDAVDGFVADQDVNHNPMAADGREANRALWAGWFAAFPDTEMVLGDVVTCEARVAGRPDRILLSHATVTSPHAAVSAGTQHAAGTVPVDPPTCTDSSIPSSRTSNPTRRNVMNPVIQVLTVLAVMGTAVVYGTDVFCAAVQRPALAHVDDATLTAVMGRVHQFGDRRMPIPGVTGLAAAATAAVLAVITGRPLTAALTAAATIALIVWLAVYTEVSAPINKQLTIAAIHHHTPPGARGLQRTWDRVIGIRALLQGIALAALCVALAT